MALKKNLEEFVRRRGYITYTEMEIYCKTLRYRPSTGERRLRESPNIEPVFKEKDLFNKKSYIVGYRYKNN